MSTLGICVSAHAVRAVILTGNRDRIAWAGSVEWEDLPGLSAALGRLAADAGKAVRSARITLSRDVVQCRTIVPAPPLSGRAVGRYVALEADRLFRRNGSHLVTDARIVMVDKNTRALWAAAAPEDFVRALLDGCTQAGLRVDAIGPAADVAPAALNRPVPGDWIFPNGGTSEVVSLGAYGVWRSRNVLGTRDLNAPMHPALAALNEEATHFAPAFAAALVVPRLMLFPGDTRAARERTARRRLFRVFALAASLWILAGVIYVGRLATTGRAARRDLAAVITQVDSVLVLRRELESARATLTGFGAAERYRSRHLALLADLSRALDDSVHLLTLQISPAGDVRLTADAVSPFPVLASLQRVAGLRNVRLQGRAEGNRYSIVAQQASP